MPTPMSITRGTVISNAKPASADWNREELRTAFIDNGLHNLFNDSEWGVGGISFNSASPVAGNGRNGGKGKYAAAQIGERFAAALNSVVQTEIAKELELSGYFTLSIDTGDEPVVFRVDVEDGKVSYQQANYVWSNAVIV